MMLLSTVGVVAIIWRAMSAFFARRTERKIETQTARQIAMAALEAGDRTRLNNILAVYGDLLPKRVRIDLQERSENLLVDAAMEEDISKRRL